MSRTFTIEELNKIIDEFILEYEESDMEAGGLERHIYQPIIKALQELKVELNSPEPLVNVSENIQQSINVETTKIITNDL